MNEQVITIDDFAKVVMTVGEIKSCEPVVGSNKLYKLSVDMGELGIRQVLSGIAKSYTAEELVGRKAVFVSNLQPREMAGMTSHGMILTTLIEGGLARLLMVDPLTPNGTRIR